MLNRRRARPYGLVLGMLLLMVACDSTTEPAVVGAVDLAPVDTVLTVGGERQLAATVISPTGSVLSGYPVEWVSSLPDIASVTASGLVTGVSAGRATVSAESGGRSRAVTFTVTPGECTEATAGTITVGETATGTLGPTNCTVFRNQPAAGWSLSLSSPTTLSLEVSSSDFWPGLIVTDLERNAVAGGEPYAEGSVRTIAQLPAGQYIVWATSYGGQPVGTYELSVREVRHCDAATIEASIRPGGYLEGRLDEEDCLFLHGLPADGFRLVLDGPTNIQVDLTSAEFDPSLIITDLQMEPLWWNDDWAGALDARIVRRLPAGEYVVWVTSFGSSGYVHGAYGLSAQEVDLEPCPVVGELAVGDARAGSLTEASCALPDARYADVWALTVTESVTLRLDLTSDQFDAYLVLEDEDGTPLAGNDDGGVGLNARLFHEVAPGRYRVVVTTYGLWEMGTYELATQAWAGTVAAGSSPRPPGWGPFDRKPAPG